MDKATHESIGMRITINEDCDLKERGLAERERAKLFEDIDAYLSTFTKPGNCPKCNAKLDGLLGSFTWGIVHGEGKCAKCGWPCRAYHRIVDRDDEEVFERPLAIVLPYHEDHVVKEEENASR